MARGKVSLSKKIGILGGGQLGRMLQELALKYGIELYFLDSDRKAPCAVFAEHFTHGSYRDFDPTIKFGKDKDILTIEIEHVSVEALEQLAKYNIEIIPTVSSIQMIKNKAFQKQFYRDKKIPTSDFQVFDSNALPKDIDSSWYPFVQKSQTDGYDGKGVVVIENESELKNQLNCPSIIEKKVEIEKELAITVAIEKSGAIHLFPICEMVFDPKLNLVDYLIAPAIIDENVSNQLLEITTKLGKAIKSPGIFSIEFFLTKSGEILVNEIAPRAHNSAHYTIEGTNISQFEAQLRILLNLSIPLIQMKGFAGMVNLVGEPKYNGTPAIAKLDELCKMDNAYIHLYGKKETKPGRKMGHVTVLSDTREELIEKLNWVKENVKIIS